MPADKEVRFQLTVAKEVESVLGEVVKMQTSILAISQEVAELLVLCMKHSAEIVREATDEPKGGEE